MGAGGLERGIARIQRWRWQDGQVRAEEDEVAVEAPLQINLAGEPFLVTMRTPGDDAALTLGLLYAEGLIRDVDDVAAIAPCGEPGRAAVDVRPGPGVVFEDPRQRQGAVSSACGICGRDQIDDLLARIPVVKGAIAPRPLEAAIPALEAVQPRFARTGSLHAAVILDETGETLASAEDIGRHNAVDKAVGVLLRERKRGAVLGVSGRASFDIVQKAAVARLRAVVAVSGPSSLAVELASEAGIVLAGFARGDGMNIYTHIDRLR
ncbi:MAG: formate dehydrogenase accessory sulfurtransferase FdhD [Myxococcota bacterium]